MIACWNGRGFHQHADVEEYAECQRQAGKTVLADVPESAVLLLTYLSEHRLPFNVQRAGYSCQVVSISFDRSMAVVEMANGDRQTAPLIALSF